MARNWNDMGISFVSENVSERVGPNDSSKRVLGTVPIAVVSDLDKFRAEFGDAVILGIMDGTSVRVICQDIGRRGLKAKKNDEAIREDIYNRLKGVRVRSATVQVKEVKVYTLPGGSTWSGDNLVEYQAAYMAALVDAGTPAEIAKNIALTITL